MEKRKYTKMQTLEAEIVSMHEDGKTHREIAAELKRLRMENRLLRDFPELGGRGCGRE